jgi:beta-lactam-binding protein with PASTA domain
MDTTVAGLPIGHLLDGRYRVDARIARGGMATVYLGTDTRLERAVALKIAHAEFASDDGFVRRFIDEAKSVARLSSPNVVAVYDQGADGAILFLAMEYVPGQTLRQLLMDRVRLRPREALDIIEGVLTGLAAAHESGIIHRDVKPENVLITPQGAVKVADFGLARAAARAGHTQDGMIIGTAAYLAPEQVSHSTSDARTDVYATGIMLFELLTGRQPHHGDSPLATAYKHVDEVVPAPSSMVHGLPPALDALVALATSRNPDRRPSDAGDFLRAIAGVRQGLPIAGPGTSGGGAYSAGGVAGPRGAHAAPAGMHAQNGWPDGAGGPHAHGPFEPSPWPPLAAGTGPGAPMSAGGPQDPSASTGTGFPPVTLPPVGGPLAVSLPADLVPPPAPPGGRPARHSRSGPARKVEILPAVTGYGSGPHTGPGMGAGLLAAPADAGDGLNHTLIVSDSQREEVLAGGGGRRGRGRGPRRWARGSEPFLSRWLFSRRLAYIAAALAVVLTAGLLTWWQTAGQYTTVPNVVGLTKATAREELKNLGFTVKIAPGIHDNTILRGEIVSTKPGVSGRLHKGGTITLVPSLGPVLIKVPPVSGMSLPDAQAALTKAGLKPGQVVKGASATIPAGTVLATRPLAGHKQPQTEPVTIVVSAGPPLPSMFGEQLSEAQAQAQQYGFQLNVVTDHHSKQPENTITGQSPRPGEPIIPGEVVTVRVSDGPPLVSVPNVKGLDEHQAFEILTESGFQVQVQQVGPGHRVFGQQPTDGAPVPKGSTVTLFVGFNL